MDAKYWKKLSVPLILEALFIVSTFLFPQQALFTKLIFVIAVIVWLHDEFSFRRFLRQFRNVRGFILPVTAGCAGMLVCYFLREYLDGTVWMGKTTGMIQIWYHGVPQTALFYFMTIALVPLAEELFFRGAAITFKSGRGIAVLTAVIGAFLCALTTMLGTVGILQILLMAIPPVVTYLVTENLYVPITIHYIYAICITVPEIIYEALRLALR